MLKYGILLDRIAISSYSFSITNSNQQYLLFYRVFDSNKIFYPMNTREAETQNIFLQYFKDNHLIILCFIAFPVLFYSFILEARTDLKILKAVDKVNSSSKEFILGEPVRIHKSGMSKISASIIILTLIFDVIVEISDVFKMLTGLEFWNLFLQFRTILCQFLILGFVIFILVKRFRFLKPITTEEDMPHLKETFMRVSKEIIHCLMISFGSIICLYFTGTPLYRCFIYLIVLAKLNHELLLRWMEVNKSLGVILQRFDDH